MSDEACRTRPLTRKQEALLGYLAEHEPDVMNEGNIADDLWPLIRQVRHVAHALEAKGMLRLGDHWDECGYDLHLTDAGRAVVVADSAAAGGPKDPAGEV